MRGWIPLFLFAWALAYGVFKGSDTTWVHLTVVACTSGLASLLGTYHSTLVNRLSAIEAKIDHAAEKTEEVCDVCKH